MLRRPSFLSRRALPQPRRWISVTARLAAASGLSPAGPRRWRVHTRCSTCSTGRISLGCAAHRRRSGIGSLMTQMGTHSRTGRVFGLGRSRSRRAAEPRGTAWSASGSGGRKKQGHRPAPAGAAGHWVCTRRFRSDEPARSETVRCVAIAFKSPSPPQQIRAVAEESLHRVVESRRRDPARRLSRCLLFNPGGCGAASLAFPSGIAPWLPMCSGPPAAAEAGRVRHRPPRRRGLHAVPAALR